MDRFFDILRAEFEKELSVGGNYSSKAVMMAAFDRAFARATVKYAKERGIDLT